MPSAPVCSPTALLDRRSSLGDRRYSVWNVALKRRMRQVRRTLRAAPKTRAKTCLLRRARCGVERYVLPFWLRCAARFLPQSLLVLAASRQRPSQSVVLGRNLLPRPVPRIGVPSLNAGCGSVIADVPRFHHRKQNIVCSSSSGTQARPSSRVACAFLVYMLSPLPRRSGWASCFARFTQPCQPSPIWRSGRPAHCPFRGLLGVHCVTACTLALSPYIVTR